MPLFIRCDASPSIGLGHAARALALGEELGRRLGTAPVVLAHDEPLLRSFLDRQGVALRPLRGDGYALEEVLVETAGEAMLVSDTRELGESALREIAASGVLHVVVDDFADAGSEWPCDTVVNPNLDAPADRYPGARHVLTGPRFALLRREIRDAAAHRVEPGRVASKLLVCLGGGAHGWGRPESDALLNALGALPLVVRAATAAGDWPGVECVRPSTLAEQLIWADLAVLSAGVIKYEAAACGLPMLLTAVAPDQRGFPDAFAREGAADALAPLEELLPTDVAREVTALAADAERRSRLATAARRLCDGRGVERVAEVVLEA